MYKRKNVLTKLIAVLCAAAMCFGSISFAYAEEPLPSVIASPDVSALPDASASPEISASPDVSASPDASEAPGVSASPELSPSPSVSSAPVDTATRLDVLKSNIAELYSGTTTDWQIFDMVCGGYLSKLTAKSEAADSLTEAAYNSASLNELERYGFALKALGKDISKLKTASGEEFSLLKKLSDCGTESIGYVTDAIMALSLYNTAEYNPESGLTNQSLIDYILSSRSESGVWGYSWDGVDYVDYDSTAMVLNAFAPYYNAASAEKAGISQKDYDEIKATVDKAVSVLSEIQSDNGSLGNANTDAVAVIGLASVGINPMTDKNFVSENGSSLIDGMLVYALGDNSGFGYMDNSDVNALATEQAFRAVIAYLGLKESKDGKYNVYDIVPLDSEQQGGSSGGNSGGSTGESPEIQISVTCAVKGDTVHEAGKHKGGYPTWISKVQKSVVNGSTVAELLKTVLSENGYKAQGLDSGYISSVTSPDGITLAEKTNGKNSGWLYKVNSKSPSVGIGDYKLKSGDYVELYYTDDYTKEPSSVSGGGNSGGSTGSSVGSSAAASPSPSASASASEPPEATASPQGTETVLFSDVTPDCWAYGYIMDLAESGVLSGDDDGKFRPDDCITRAEFVAVIARASGAEPNSASAEFSDVSDDSWYVGYIGWAASNGIVNGVGEGLFEPDSIITREDVCVIIVRVTDNKNTASTHDDISFTDANEISDYALNDVNTLKQSEIINGYDDGSFRPKAGVTRAEVSKIISLAL